MIEQLDIFIRMVGDSGLRFEHLHIQTENKQIQLIKSNALSVGWLLEEHKLLGIDLCRKYYGIKLIDCFFKKPFRY